MSKSVIRTLRELKTLPSALSQRCQYSSSDANQSTPPKVCKGAKPEELGQPSFATHPHLFAPSTTLSVPFALSAAECSKQVTPFITKQELEQRRHAYVDYLSAYQSFYFSTKLSRREKANKAADVANLKHLAADEDHNFIALIPAATLTYMAPDVMHTFKQNSDFLYLTGFNEPSSVLVLSRCSDRDVLNKTFTSAIFVADKSGKRELWEGPCTGPRAAPHLLGIEHVYAIGELKAYLDSLMRSSSPASVQRTTALWRYPVDNVRQESGPDCRLTDTAEADVQRFVDEHTQSSASRLVDMLEQDAVNSSSAASYYNSSRYFAQLCRLKKSAAEQALMEHACNVSSAAFEQCMRVSHPLVNEHLLYAKFDFECRIRGAEYLAYIPVVAGGPRATTLHYIRNNQLVDDGHMLLMDAGCQYGSYASDITRTWPVGNGGRYTPAQRELYAATLSVQRKCLAQCVPGVSIQQLFNVMMRALSEELAGLGLVRPEEHAAAVRASDSPLDPLPMGHVLKLSKYCPHDVGHYLGMDVHDCPEVSKHVALEPHTVITIEPGIYVRADDENAPFRYRGIGIRIEDDVLITEQGCRVLSAKCPKELDDIEAILTA